MKRVLFSFRLGPRAGFRENTVAARKTWLGKRREAFAAFAFLSTSVRAKALRQGPVSERISSFFCER